MKHSTTMLLVPFLLAAACATAPPPAPKIVTEQTGGTTNVSLPESVFVETWDGGVSWKLDAQRDSSAALIMLTLRAEQSRYRDCRSMSLQLDEDSEINVETSYKTELDIDAGESVETFRVTVSPDQLVELAEAPRPAFKLCDDPFELAPQQVQRVVEFIQQWRPDVEVTPRKRPTE